MEKEVLETISTKELVEELKKRVGVKFIEVPPHKEKTLLL